MAGIGDLVWRMVADSSGMLKQAEVDGAKAGDKAGAGFGKTFSKGLALAASGAFALATKGAIDLDDATRRVAASSGIAASELSGFRSQVVQLFKDNPSKGFEEIAATIGTLKTDLGLSTVEAGKAAQAFLDFSKVTGQDGTSAVKGLDDILDAFNLAAGDSQRVMDLLVASHEKYGGSVTANQAALSAMAPALLALNVGLDEGVALLNLFSTSGLDASAASMALKKAVDGLKPGQTFDDLIAQIASIEDPTLRAQKAIDIFGVRGGIGLANAFKPGMKGLDDFKLSTEAIAGATTDAADIIDTSFRSQIDGAIRQVTGTLAEFGAALGPLITTGGSLALLAGQIGLASGAFNLLKIRAILAWAAAAGPAAFVAAAALVAALLIIENELNGVGSSAEQYAAAAANGTDSTKAWAAALGAATPPVQETAAAVAAAIDPTNAWSVAIGAATGTAAAGAPAVTALGAAAAELGTGFQHAAGDVGAAVQGVGSGMHHMADEAEGFTQDIARSNRHLVDDTEEMAQDVGDSMTLVPQAVRAQVEPTLLYSEAIAAAMHDGIINKRQLVVDAWDRLVQDQKIALMRGVTLSALLGKLQSTQLQSGIRSKVPGILADAGAFVNATAAVLAGLGVSAYKIGQDTMDNLKRGLAGRAATGRDDFATAIGKEAIAAIASPFAGFGSLEGQVAALIGQIAGMGVQSIDTADGTNELAVALGLADAAAERAAGSTKKKTGADKGAAQAAKDHATELKGNLASAFDRIKAKAHDYFDSLHSANLKAIDDERRRTQETIDASRKRIQAHLEEVRATAMAPVTEAEKAVRAAEDAQRLRDLNESIADAQTRLSEAQASGDQAQIESANRSLRNAQESLASFQAQAGIDAARAAAEAAIAIAEAEAKTEEGKLDTADKTADTTRDLAVEAENERHKLAVAAFDEQIGELEKKITGRKTSVAAATREITKLLDSFGIDFKKAGSDWGAALAAGLDSQAAAVATAAANLAGAANDYLKTGSPAKKGPWHDDPPETLGQRFVRTLVGGALGQVRRSAPALAAAAGAIGSGLMPSMALPNPASLAYATTSHLGDTRGMGGPMAGPVSNRSLSLSIGSINNPVPEAAGVSMRQRLQLLSTGLGG